MFKLAMDENLVRKTISNINKEPIDETLLVELQTKVSSILICYKTIK